MTLAEVEDALFKVIDGFEWPLPKHQLKDMKELCRAGEPGIALENFATQLVEYEIAIPATMIAEMEALGDAMGLDKKYWQWLREVPNTPA